MNRFLPFLLLFWSLMSSCHSQESSGGADQERKSNYLKENWMSKNQVAGNKVMILLDPHGESAMVLAKYEALAQKNHFTLYASPLIFNGLNVAIVNEKIDSLIAFINQDNKSPEIILTGFSGGAKYALMYAANHSSINRVIACGAVTEVNLGNTPSLLFCGERDMNYASMRLNNSQNCSHIVWPGKHEWPDIKTFSIAFANASSWQAANAPITDEVQASLEKELNLHKSYMEGYGGFSDLVWADISQYLLMQSTNLMNVRSKGVLSMMGYLYTDHFIKIGQLDQATKFCKRYLEIDPENADAYYFKALLAVRKGQLEESKTAMQKSLQLGWHETADKKKDPALNY